MKKPRKYNTRRISRNRSYTIQEITELFGLHKNSVLIWLRTGLKKIDCQKPYLINGGDLVDFLEAKKKKRRQKCKPNELFCLKCKSPRLSKPDCIQITERNIYRLKISGRCQICNTKMFKDASVQRRSEIEKTFAIIQQPQKHISVCNDSSLNSDIQEIIQYDSI